MLADQPERRLVHRIEIKAAKPWHGYVTYQRIRPTGVIAHPIGVSAPQGAESCVEALRGSLHCPDPNIIRQCSIDSVGVEVRVPFLDPHIEMRNLASSMHTSVCAPRTGDL